MLRYLTCSMIGFFLALESIACPSSYLESGIEADVSATIVFASDAVTIIDRNTPTHSVHGKSFWKDGHVLFRFVSGQGTLALDQSDSAGKSTYWQKGKQFRFNNFTSAGMPLEEAGVSPYYFHLKFRKEFSDPESRSTFKLVEDAGHRKTYQRILPPQPFGAGAMQVTQDYTVIEEMLTSISYHVSIPHEQISYVSFSGDFAERDTVFALPRRLTFSIFPMTNPTYPSYKATVVVNTLKEIPTTTMITSLRETVSEGLESAVYEGLAPKLKASELSKAGRSIPPWQTASVFAGLAVFLFVAIATGVRYFVGKRTKSTALSR